MIQFICKSNTIFDTKKYLLNMLREIVKIDEDLCDGCGNCVPGCHEGALQIIDGKARLVSELMCDGLGACIGHCPQDAISIEKREAEAYDETRVMEVMVSKGANTVIAHMKHLKEHNENELLEEAARYLEDNATVVDFDTRKVILEVNNTGIPVRMPISAGCPGSMAQSTEHTPATTVFEPRTSQRSELTHWPVQMHLINPSASHYKNADVLMAADCVAYTVPNFHDAYLRGNKLAIACPKLDHGTDIYIDKIRSLIDDANIRSLHILVMEVPCCSGLSRMVQIARSQALKEIPVKVTVVSIQGEVLKSVNI